MREIRVLLVDDHKILREGLRHLLDLEEDVSIVATAGTAKDGLAKALGAAVDVAVIDISLPDHDGLWLIDKLKAEKPDLPVIILSMHSDEATVLKMLEAGASGYLTKSAEASEVIAAVRSAYSGGSYVQAAIAPFLIGALRRKGRLANADLHLDDREAEILRRVAQGQSNQRIAGEMFLSLSTIKAQLRSLFKKLEASTRTEVVLSAMRHGLLAQPASENQ